MSELNSPGEGTPSPVRSGAELPVEPQPLIEDHALIGDLHTAALITKDGVLDWLCLPAFDSDACFAALLGSSEHGSWKLAPAIAVSGSRRRYRPDTLILETEFSTETGKVRVVDFMPPHEDSPRVIRTVVGLEGQVPMHSELAPRFAFGRAIPRTQTQGTSTVALAGPDALYLRGGPRFTAPPLSCRFNVKAGQRVSFELAHGASFQKAPAAVDPAHAERLTERYWLDWVSRIKVPSQHRDLVVRSLITLKACIYAPTGGIVAAPTCSLPETPGGIRNWDYRFCWLRDAALTLGAFIAAGLTDEAQGFWGWVQRAIAGEPSQVQIMYGIRGERRLTEATLDWLPGYGGARPVRIGNAAYEQFQLDVFGEVAMTVYSAAVALGRVSPADQQALLTIADFVAENWRTPDQGIWEMRGPKRHFTASKVSAWVAVDRAIKAIEQGRVDHSLDQLRAIRQEIFDEVCEKGWNAELNTFTQYYGGTGLDASLLALPLLGFLPADDPRVAGTVAAIERTLLDEGLVLRFRPEADVDGLEGEEGVFLACSCWLVDVYVLMGRMDDARRLFERVTSVANDLGLLAEEYDPKSRRQLGNFPQAFTHFALVRSAYLLSGQPLEQPLAQWTH